jgi:hypothetical protein
MNSKLKIALISSGIITICATVCFVVAYTGRYKNIAYAKSQPITTETAINDNTDRTSHKSGPNSERKDGPNYEQSQVEENAANVRFKPNHGDGRAALQALGIKVDEMDLYDAKDSMEIIALDTTLDKELGNRALNSLRQFNYKEFQGLAVAIINANEFSDDYRSYATQHLVLYLNPKFHTNEGEYQLKSVLMPLLSGTYPEEVKREAAYGLSQNVVTKEGAVSWLREQVKNGGEKSYGDLYVRVCKENDIIPDIRLR